MSDVATTEVPSVRTKRSRIAGIDVARGIALIGMAATHMLQVSGSMGLTLVGWLFAGKASALFAVLAGVSLAIVTGGTKPFSGKDLRRSRITIAVRAALIGVLGLLLAASDTYVAVILQYYAVLFLLALPFLRFRARTLAILALAWALLSPQISFLLRGALGIDMADDQVDIGMVVTQPLTSLHTLLLTGYYPAFTWLTYILAGLALGRLDLRSTRAAAWIAGIGAVIAVSSYLVSSALLDALQIGVVMRGADGPYSVVGRAVNEMEFYGTTSSDVPEWLLVASPHSGTTFDVLLTTGTAMLVLGLCLLLVRGIGVRISRPVAAVGSMTLTLYTLHVLSLAGLVPHDQTQQWYVAQVVIALVVAPLWLMRFRRGPIEEIVHDVSTTAGLAAVPREPVASG